MDSEMVGGQGNPFLAAPKTKKMLTLVGIYVAILGSLIQSNTMSTLLPIAAAEVGGTDYYSLASTVSGVVGIVLMPLWGYLCARNPHIKRPLFAASLIIGAATILVRAFAPSMMVVIVSGSLYGLVSCGIYVVGFSMIRDMYEAEKAGTYLGLCGTIMMVGALVGPVLGGVIMTAFGWRVLCNCIWPFMVVGGLIVLFGGIKVTKEEVAHLASTKASFDASGAIIMAIFTGALVIGLSVGTSFMPFGSLPSNLTFVVALIALIAFIISTKKKGDAAIVPFSAFKDRNTLCYIVANFFSSVANMALFFFLPLYVLRVMGLSATDAGLIMACYSIAGLFLSPIYGKIIGKSGSARSSLLLVSAVRVAVALGFIFLLTPTMPIWLACILMLIGGIYNCAGGSIFSAGPQVQIRSEIRVQGNAVIQQMQTLGSSIGIAAYTVCIGIGGMQGGFTIALVVSIVCAAIAGVAALGLKKLEN